MSPASSEEKGKSAPAATIARAAASEAVRFIRIRSTRVLSRSNRMARIPTKEGPSAWATLAESGLGPSRRRGLDRDRAPPLRQGPLDLGQPDRQRRRRDDDGLGEDFL